MNRPGFAEGSGDPPRAAPLVAFENEHALLRADEQLDLARHRDASGVLPRIIEQIGAKRRARSSAPKPRAPRAKSPAPAIRPRRARVRRACRRRRRVARSKPAGSRPCRSTSPSFASKRRDLVAQRRDARRQHFERALLVERQLALRRAAAPVASRAGAFSRLRRLGAARAGKPVAALRDHVGIAAGIFDASCPSPSATRTEVATRSRKSRSWLTTRTVPG